MGAHVPEKGALVARGSWKQPGKPGGEDSVGVGVPQRSPAARSSGMISYWHTLSCSELTGRYGVYWTCLGSVCFVLVLQKNVRKNVGHHLLCQSVMP